MTTERRKHPRRGPAATEPLSRIRLRLGPELKVLNVADAGVLVDSAARLVPGGRVDVHVVGRTGRVLVRCTVVRSRVFRVRHDSIAYEAGLHFDQSLDTSAG